MQLEIKELRLDDNFWRIDWLGGLWLGDTSHTDAKIVTYLTALNPDFQKVFNSDAVAKPERRTFKLIKADQIALLKIGSVWRHGKRIQLWPEQRSELTFTICHDQLRFMRFDESVQVHGQAFRLLDPLRYKVGLDASIELAGAPLVVAENLGTGSPVDLIAIPSAVLFQRALATSSTSVRRLLYGEIEKIADIKNSGFVEGEPNTFKITLHKQFSDVEGKAIANILSDKIAQQNYERMRMALVAGKAGEMSHDPPRRNWPHIHFGLPFSRPVSVKAAGKFLRFDVKNNGGSEKVWGFLVTEILSLNATLEFTRLAIERKNNSLKGGNSDDPDLEEISFGRRTKVQKTNGGRLLVNSDDDPATNLDKEILETTGGFIAEPLEILDRHKDLQRYRNARLFRKDGEPFGGQHTTGDPTGTQSGVSGVEIEADELPETPMSLEQLFQALSMLQQRGIHFSTLKVSPLHRRRVEDDHIVNFFRRRGGANRNWRLVAENRSVTRGYVVAEIHYGEVWHYLLDIEQKRSGEISMLHLMTMDGSRIEPKRLDDFMESVARLNGWKAIKNYSQIWRSNTIRHSRVHGHASVSRSIAKVIGLPDQKD